MGKNRLADRLRQIEDKLLKISTGVTVAAPLLLLFLGKLYTATAEFYRYQEQQ